MSLFVQGRDGKGSIFLWANGNGGDNDDCATDGYASSIYTISVGGIGMNGNPSSFDEVCAAKMVVSYVTDDRGLSTVVSHLTKPHVPNNNPIYTYFSPLQHPMEIVLDTLEEPVQQLHWQQESLL